MTITSEQKIELFDDLVRVVKDLLWYAKRQRASFSNPADLSVLQKDIKRAEAILAKVEAK